MKKILGMLAVLMLASQFSFAAKSSNTDAAIQRLVKVAKQRQAARERGEVIVNEQPVVVETETVTTTVPAKKVKPVKSVKKDTTNRRISKRVDEINNNIEKFHKTNQLLDQMEERLDAIQDRIGN